MNNVYGTKRPANISSDDIEIFYMYKPSRAEDDSNFTTFKSLDSKLLSTIGQTGGDLPGMYNLRLPVDKFSKKGIYTVYIKPKEIDRTIVDVSTLAAFPSIKGIVISVADLPENLRANGGLVGYRVEYLDDEGKRTQDFRIITSSNLCEPVAQNLNDSKQKGVRYRFNDSSTLLFCTLTPSTGHSFKANSEPFIGKSTQKIKLINTKFNPVCMEIEMVEHDEETISWMLEGDQLRNFDKGLITTFNSKGEIYHQTSVGTTVDPNNKMSHDFRVKNTDNIDFEENIDRIVKDNL